jgi:hypothetical protein
MRSDLVELAPTGDMDAFGRLAATHVDRLLIVARLILRDRDLADDAVQEALVRCWRYLPTLHDVDRFEARCTRVRRGLLPGIGLGDIRSDADVGSRGATGSAVGRSAAGATTVSGTRNAPAKNARPRGTIASDPRSTPTAASTNSTTAISKRIIRRVSRMEAPSRLGRGRVGGGGLIRESRTARCMCDGPSS